MRRLGRAIPWIALIVAAGVAGWLLLGESPEPSGVSVGYVPLPTTTPTPRMPRAFSLPGGVTDTSALVMIQGGVARRLTVWSLGDDAPPVEVDRGIHPAPLLPNPAGTRVLYSVGRAVMVLDVPARRARIIGELPEDGALLSAQWSPNGQMIAYVVQFADERVSFVAWQDGSQPAREVMRVQRGLPIDVAWLADGRPVTIFMRIGPVGGLEARRLVYDWMADERALLPPDVKVFQPYQVNRQAMALDKKDAGFMHCLPAKRGLEATADVMESEQSIVFDEAENRLHAQKAVLVTLMRRDAEGLCPKRRARRPSVQPMVH